MGGTVVAGNSMLPLYYQQAGPLTALDSEADSLVHASIAVEAQAEYSDVYEETLGGKKAKTSAALN